MRQDQLNVPFELVAGRKTQERLKLAKALLTGQQPAIAPKIHWAKAEAHPMLALTAPPPEHGTLPQTRAVAPLSEAALTVKRDAHPSQNELIEFGVNPEEVLDQGLNDRGRPRAQREIGDVTALDIIGQTIPMALGSEAKTAKGADIEVEAIALLPVGLHGRLGFGKGTVDEAQETMLQKVDEACEAGVVPALQPLFCLQGIVQRQRTVRPEQTEGIEIEAVGLTVARLERLKFGGRELQIGILTETNGVVARTLRMSQPGLVVMGTLEPPKRLEEAERSRIGFQRFDEA